MNESKASANLAQLIAIKEAELKTDGDALKAHFHLTYASLKPVNIVKGVLKDMFAAPDLKTDVVNTALGVTTGFVAKKAFVGASNNPLKKLAGVILEMVVASNVISNGDEIRAMGNVLVKKITGLLKDTEKV